MLWECKLQQICVVQDLGIVCIQIKFSQLIMKFTWKYPLLIHDDVTIVISYF